MAKKKVEVNPQQIDMFAEADAERNKPNFTEEQETFIKYTGKNSVILSATAGAGKTFSCVERLKFLVEVQKVDPSRIIFFSFTKAATLELAKRIGRDDIEIRTIHSYCGKVLTRLKKGREIVDYMKFIEWFKQKHKLPRNASQDEKVEFEDAISRMYEESQYNSSQISSFKLQKESGIKVKLPDLWGDYINFLRETKSRDMTDLLIEVNKLFKEDRYLKMFKNKYDYIFVDEYQDTSSIQMDVLLALNAKYYYLIGDKNQSIFGFSGSNCAMVEDLLKKRRKTDVLNLSMNFRSDISIIENSNKYSSLQAIPSSTSKGFVDKQVMFRLDHLIDILNNASGEVAVLARTNKNIKKLEYELLKLHIPIRYSNYITESDIKDFRKSDKMRPQTKLKFSRLKSYFNGSEKAVAAFIINNINSKKFITSIHKSKGLEFDTCVVVNSIAPDVLMENGIYDKLTPKQLDRISFELGDPKYEEAQNIHYVAVSRSKYNLHFMIYDF
jgi:superfamily I DNA/RNA helicase